MRTTLAIDDDALLFAKTMAQRERISVGQAVSKLLRQAAMAPVATTPAGKPKSKYSVYPARSGPLITSDDVYRLMDQEGI